jgi:transposase
MKHADFRALAPGAQEDLRKKTVRAVLGGMTHVEAARVFGVTRQAVGAWMTAYEKGGAVALRAKPRGRPRTGGSLEAWQAAQIVRTIEDRCPEQLKLPFFLWTREAVGQLIALRFGIELSVSTVGRYLARWGFTPQKPVRRAREQNQEAVATWMKVEYPRIRTAAKRAGGLVFWGDEMGLRSDHQTGRTYGRVGVTPVILGTGRRFGCNMISAITNRGQLAFMVFKHRFTAPVFLRFLARLLKQRAGKGPVFLIVDRHPVHVSARVSTWVAQRSAMLKLHFLPGYSPELNPDELLNQDVKSNAVGRRRANDQSELLANVRGYLRSTQRQPAIVQNYFREAHVSYASV